MLPVAGLTAQATVVPEGKFSTENCWVFAGATVTVAGLTLMGGGEACRVKVADPRTVFVDELVAVTLMVVCAATVLGAVYRPALVMLPVAGLTAQATLVPEGKFSTENCWVFAGATVTVGGLTLMGGGEAWRVKLPVPRTAFVDELVAVTLMVVCVATVLGAV
jgi:hypothetical protein